MATKKFGRLNVNTINTGFQEMPPGHQKQVREIAEAIRRGDNIPPILVNRSGYLQDGRHRLAAYKLLGMQEVDVEYGYHPAAKPLKKNTMKRKLD
jgi:ParB-like nuclease domain